MLPFPGGIEATANGTLILSIGAAILYTFVLARPETLLRSSAKTLSVALLAYLAYLQNAPGLLVLALVLSALGDAFLSREGDAAFLGGLASFLAAHVAYIVLFAGHGDVLQSIIGETWRVVVALVMAVTSAGVLAILLRRVPGTLRIPVIAYSIAILFMGLASLTAPHIWIVAGAALFMASDTLLGWERFVMTSLSRNRVAVRYAVWVLYYAAQLIITLAYLLKV